MQVARFATEPLRHMMPVRLKPLGQAHECVDRFLRLQKAGGFLEAQGWDMAQECIARTWGATHSTGLRLAVLRLADRLERLRDGLQAGDFLLTHPGRLQR